ncbi:MAG TPA: GlsB/YeaQ/YmgE family stress response membrane protein [Sphingomicrobium sp.]|nr:GlsB/YeaQ/YmgE family stress response membrane protein [Sphingomicrobium sp.]
MGFIVWLVIGGIIGWLASLIMRTDAQQGIILNIVVGIVGAVIAGLVIAGGISPANPLELSNILWSLVGAVVLLAIVNLIRRGTMR